MYVYGYQISVGKCSPPLGTRCYPPVSSTTTATTTPSASAATTNSNFTRKFLLTLLLPRLFFLIAYQRHNALNILLTSVCPLFLFLFLNLFYLFLEM
jgi:hypothetical protein